MARDPAATRRRIMDAALDLTLEQGFPATSVDQVLRRAGVTKGAFFHHFENKAALARAIVQRFADDEQRLLDETLARCEKLSRDPLQQLLLLLGFYEEMFAEVQAPPPGCLLASFCYQGGLDAAGVDAITARAMRDWRATFRQKLDQVAAVHRPRLPVDLDDLADLSPALFEGAFVLARTLGDPQLVARQLRLAKTFLELLFEPEDAAAAGRG